jgi:hypothetical protein
MFKLLTSNFAKPGPDCWSTSPSRFCCTTHCCYKLAWWTRSLAKAIGSSKHWRTNKYTPPFLPACLSIWCLRKPIVCYSLFHDTPSNEPLVTDVFLASSVRQPNGSSRGLIYRCRQHTHAFYLTPVATLVYLITSAHQLERLLICLVAALSV